MKITVNSFIATGAGGISYAVGISIALGVVFLVSSLCFSATFFTLHGTLRRLGVAVRSGVMMAVYKQSLKLTSASRLTNTVGQTTNLIAIEKLFLAAQFFHFIWHGPLASFIVMLLLIREVGYAPSLVGLAWILILIPLQNLVADNIGYIRRFMIKHTDERVKLINELLQSIRSIKYFGWEIPFVKRVQDVRGEEVSQLRRYLFVSAMLRYHSSMSPMNRISPSDLGRIVVRLVPSPH